MEPNRSAIIVGCVLLVLCAFGIGVGWWLGQAGREAIPDRYAVYFVKQSLAGLEAGSPVTMLGIKVGQVEAVSIDATDFTRVRVELGLRPGTPVCESTTALIQRNLLTGLAGIDVVGSTPASPLLPKVKGQGVELPVIREGIPQLVQLQRSLPAILENLDKVLYNASEVINDENRARFHRIIVNLEDVTKGLSDTTGVIQSRTAEISEVLSMFVKSLNSETSRVSRTFEEASSRFILQIGTLTNGVNETLKVVTSSLERIESPRKIILGPSRGDLGPGEAYP